MGGNTGAYSYRDVIQGGLSISTLAGSNPETVAEFIEKRSLSETLPAASSETLEELERRFGQFGASFIEEAGRTIADFLIEDLLAVR